jgi:hypothetical protein
LVLGKAHNQPNPAVGPIASQFTAIERLNCFTPLL